MKGWKGAEGRQRRFGVPWASRCSMQLFGSFNSRNADWVMLALQRERRWRCKGKCMYVCTCVRASPGSPVSKFLSYREEVRGMIESTLGMATSGVLLLDTIWKHVGKHLSQNILFILARRNAACVPYFGTSVTSDQSSVSTKTCNFDFTPRFHLRSAPSFPPRNLFLSPLISCGPRGPHAVFLRPPYAVLLRPAVSFALRPACGALNLETCVHTMTTTKTTSTNVHRTA